MGCTIVEESNGRLVFETRGMPLCFIILIPGLVMFPAIIILATTIAFTYIPALVVAILVIVSLIYTRVLSLDSVPTTWTVTFLDGKAMIHRERNSFSLCCMPAVSEDYELASGLCASLQYGRKGTRIVIHLANGQLLPTTTGSSNLYRTEKEQLVYKLNSFVGGRGIIQNQTFFVPNAQPSVFMTPPVYPPPEVQPSAYVKPEYAPPEPYSPPPTIYVPPQVQMPPAFVLPPVQQGYVPPPTDSSARNLEEQMCKLNELQAQGVLSQEEFQQAKARVLQEQ